MGVLREGVLSYGRGSPVSRVIKREEDVCSFEVLPLIARLQGCLTHEKMPLLRTLQ